MRKAGTIKAIIPSVMIAVFIGLSNWTYKTETNGGIICFLLGAIACMAILMFVIRMSENKRQIYDLARFARYTAPIFLMHTLYAAPCRILLLKAGIMSVVLQMAVGIVVSFAGPILVAKGMEKTKALDFLLYPGKYIRL